MKPAEIRQKFAELFHLQAPSEGKKVQFEKLPKDEQQVYLSLAENILINIDKLNLTLVPKVKPEEAKRGEVLFRDRLEGTISEFFDSIRIWKRDAIPQQELVSRIFQLLKG